MKYATLYFFTLHVLLACATYHRFTMKNEVLQKIKDLQSGVYHKSHVIAFNPEITGRGVSIIALSDHFEDPKETVKAIKELILEGKVRAIDPDADNFVSFVAL